AARVTAVVTPSKTLRGFSTGTPSLPRPGASSSSGLCTHRPSSPHWRSLKPDPGTPHLNHLPASTTHPLSSLAPVQFPPPGMLIPRSRHPCHPSLPPPSRNLPPSPLEPQPHTEKPPWPQLAHLL
ncbi:unnamed protein product, partial [Gulo gulo]